MELTKERLVELNRKSIDLIAEQVANGFSPDYVLFRSKQPWPIPGCVAKYSHVIDDYAFTRHGCHTHHEHEWGD